MVSHVFNESGTFTPQINTTDQYNGFVNRFIPEDDLSSVRSAIEDSYDVANYNGDQTAWLQTTVRDASFTCNTRYLYEGYHNINKSTYMMEYAVGSDIFPETLDVARHASDLLPTFWYNGFALAKFLGKFFCINAAEADLAAFAIDGIASTYQSYLASHGVSADPNLGSPKHPWLSAGDNGEEVVNTMQVSAEIFHPFNPNFTDLVNTKTPYDFWTKQAHAVQNLIDDQLGRIGPGAGKPTLQVRGDRFEL